MSCRQLVVRQSAWPRRLWWALLALALFLAWSVPAWFGAGAAPWYLPFSWLPVFYLCSAMLLRPFAVLRLEPALQLRGDGLAADNASPTATGQLLPQSLICWLGVWLLWQTADGQRQSCWIFRDALAETDFRTLARTIFQLRWQQPQPRGLSQWFS